MFDGFLGDSPPLQGLPLPGSTTQRVRHSQVPPLQGSATPKVRNSQGEPLYSGFEHFINPTYVIIIIFINSNLYLHCDFFHNPTSTDTMIIQHIFSKNSCMRIQLLVSVKDALLSSIRLLFRKNSFH